MVHYCQEHNQVFPIWSSWWLFSEFCWILVESWLRVSFKVFFLPPYGDIPDSCLELRAISKYKYKYKYWEKLSFSEKRACICICTGLTIPVRESWNDLVELLPGHNSWISVFLVALQWSQLYLSLLPILCQSPKCDKEWTIVWFTLSSFDPQGSWPGLHCRQCS